MLIERNRYLNKLISKKGNGLIKVITGIRRCGKSFLLFDLYHEYLTSVGVSDDNIIELALDEAINAKYRNPLELDKYVREQIVDVLLGLMKIKNVDLYVTGSNSRMLSSDILTEFKDRGDEIRVNPLTYSEFHAAFEGDERHAWREYYTYGGMTRAAMEHRYPLVHYPSLGISCTLIGFIYLNATLSLKRQTSYL